MISPGELAIFMRASAARTKSELTRTTGQFLDGVAVHAKAMIGAERAEWPKLADATIAEKKRLGFVGRKSATDPLLRTGDLRSSISAQTEATGDGAMGVVGSNDKVAPYHEMGTTRMPARPVFSLALQKELPKAEVRFGHCAMAQLVPGLR